MATKKPKAKPKKKPKVYKKGRKVGRPPVSYDPDYHPEQAYKYGLLMITQEKMAGLFNISPDTLYEWKKKFPEFSEAIRKSGDEADAEIAKALSERAKGFVCKVQQAYKVKMGRDQEKIEVVTLEQQLPPDTKAIGLWLGNRQRKNWKERQTVEVEATDDVITMFQKARERENRMRAELDNGDE